MLYALVLVRFRRVRYVACADCVPDVVEDNLLRNILPGNVLWLLACLPLGIAGLVASRRPGHSEEVKRLLAGAAPGAGPAPSAAAGS